MKHSLSVTVVLCVAALALFAGCSGLHPPPRLSADDPADPRAAASTVKTEASPLAEPPHDAPEDRSEPSGHSPSHQPEAKAAFSCPMHPDVQAEGPATCPKCGMKLIKVKPPGENDSE